MTIPDGLERTATGSEWNNRPTPGPYLQLEKRLAALAYALLAFSHFTLITGIIAVTINYASRQRIQGTWLESHGRWMIRTFWFSLLWDALAAATTPIGFGFFVFIADATWVAYRAIKGWIHLNRGLTMYAPNTKRMDSHSQNQTT